jgi:hypothetical protein
MTTVVEASRSANWLLDEMGTSFDILRSSVKL